MLYIEAAPGQSVEDDQKEVEDQISTMYTREDEEEEDCEGEYAEAEVPFDQDEMDEYCRQFIDFMQVELHKKYDLRSRKRSRVQENEGEQQGSIPPPMATPQQKDPVKQASNGKKPTNSLKRTNVQQAESSQDKSVDTNILERVVPVPEQAVDSRKSEEEPEKVVKQTHAFSLEKQLEKVKIQVPLLELAKIPANEKEISKFYQSHTGGRYK